MDRKSLKFLSVFAIVSIGACTSDRHSEQSLSLVPFSEFLATTLTASSSEFVGQGAVRVRGETAFSEMQSHIRYMYDGVEVTHSFLDAIGHPVDCVPVHQQPALRGTDPEEHKALLAPVPVIKKPPLGGAAFKGKIYPLQLRKDDLDPLGNMRFCDENTIPMRRITLKEMTRFETLHDFFGKIGKSDDARGRDKSDKRTTSTDQEPSVTPVHRYAHARQFVNNTGGFSYLNIWKPLVNERQLSLSQHWYTAQSTAGLQTVEGGWQVYPYKYGTDFPTLFIFWTADGYDKKRCYNLDCDAFVQLSNTVYFGKPIKTISLYKGEQYGIGMQWQLVGNLWFLFYTMPNGQFERVGYYRASIFDIAGNMPGPITKGATKIDYGGETTGDLVSYQMGSGDHAGKGFGYAAFQSYIYYIQPDGARVRAKLARIIHEAMRGLGFWSPLCVAPEARGFGFDGLQGWARFGARRPVVQGGSLARRPASIIRSA